MKYTKAMIEAIEFEVEDVILTSGGCTANTSCPEETAPCVTDCPQDDCHTVLW